MREGCFCQLGRERMERSCAERSAGSESRDDGIGGREAIEE